MVCEYICSCDIFFILIMMIYYMSQGKDVTDGWKEILLLMLGGFVGSFSGLLLLIFGLTIKENDNKFLEHIG